MNQVPSILQNVFLKLRNNRIMWGEREEEKEGVSSWPKKFRKLEVNQVSNANVYIEFPRQCSYAVFPKLIN